MIEWLLLAFLSDSGRDFLAAPVLQNRPALELITPSSVPTQKDFKLEPKFLNDPYLAVFAQDMASNKTLFSHRQNSAQPIASISKIMTYLIIRDEHELDEIVTIPRLATQIEGAKAGFYAYEKVTVETMLKALLVPSGNDAAVALAIFNAGTEEAFAEKMNQKARGLGFTSAQFYNASGLDIFEVACTDEDCAEIVEEKIFGNLMTAADVAMMARTALQDNWFRSTVAQTEFYGESADGDFVHQKKSTNKLLETYTGSKGIKTGYTGLAGQCFVNLSEDEQGREILTVVLGSSDRFGETKNLLTWITNSFDWR